MSFRIHHGDWKSLCKTVPPRGVDALIFDAPYSELTHDRHDSGVVGNDGSARKELGYKPWTPWDVSEFVVYWQPKVKGWFVTITDCELAPHWRKALESIGLVAFQPLPFVAPGSRVRKTGDGPSSWTCWIVVARPKTEEFYRWGTLDGAYILPQGQGGALPYMGGKPIWLMERLVEDYSRPGNIICDPTCGAGTTGVAALRTGRDTILGDINPEAIELSTLWCSNPGRQGPKSETKLILETSNLSLF